MTQEQIRDYIRAAIYIRTAENNDAAAEKQYNDCMQYIERKGYKFVKAYADAGISGVNNTRSGFDAMTIDAHIGEFDRIVIVSADRISRSQQEARKFCIDLQESCGVTVESVEMGVLFA